MPAIGNIAITDAETSPVTHTFAPVTTDGSTGKLANRAATIPQGYETLSVELRQPTSVTGAYRLIAKMNDPVIATVNGSDAVVRNSSASLELNFSQLSTVQERKNLIKLLSNLLNHATFISMAGDLEPLW